MAYLKWFSRGIFVIGGLLIISIVLLYVYPVSPFEPAPQERHDDTRFDLSEKVGWYRLDDGSMRLLTWAPDRGLILYGFGSTRSDLRRSQFHPFNSDSLTSSTSPADSGINFVRSLDGTIATAFLSTKSGMLTMMPVPGPYETEVVQFNSGGIELSGLQFIPNTPGPKPAAVIIHGSGASSRDGFWYLTPADYLARNGIVVILPDKRGTGKSNGQWHTASFNDFANDALSAVSSLKENSSVDSTRIGLIGFSQGGWIAPLAASMASDVSYIVTVSASAAKPSEQISYEIGAEIAGAGAPQFVAEAITPVFARRAKRSKKLWWDLNGSFDPIPYWEEFDKPSLMFFGASDQNVDVPRTLELLEQTTTTQQKLKTKVYPDLGHALIREDTGWIEPEFLSAMIQFIADL